MVARSAEPSVTSSTDVDVLVVGAGISGIGVAHHLATRRPGTSFAILEGRDEIGGTWSLFRYPGIRSDSDMPTFGYGFKPWTHRRAIADGHTIVDYLRQAVADDRIDRHIRFGHKVIGADFDTRTARWTVTAQTGDGTTAVVTSRFLFLGTGYYDYDSGFTPEFAGVQDFRGRVVHPQFWPDDLDYTGKRVVVIGSGATAVTLVPAMADRAGHVTMLQRSPSYVLAVPAVDVVATAVTRLLGSERAHRIVRRKNIAQARGLYKACMWAPRLMRKLLIAQVRARLPRHFDVDTHFTPSYNPWEQRLCMVPDGDLFATLSSGRASVVTDAITRFTTDGVLLESGRELAADVIVTATGLSMLPFGRIGLSVDARSVHLPDRVAFKAMMLSGVPNLAYALGYSNISWTLKVDLVAEHFCRLLDHMDAHGYDTVEPVLDDPGMPRSPLLDLDAGYVRRGISAFPHAGDSGPWTAVHAYETDVERLRDGPVEDPALRFATVRHPVPATRGGSR
ncbi:MAG: NAD(P)/FAD-dependent oxidoreductase [Actinomycetota bacterium]|nr:NAD(P)/FAD-dependent oxidoreductase [Actinomycetota bacterium]